ncbi:hypothetical protein CDV31_008207 [Fusarium ambrosium]|uniref:Uncharacterized protein n=1 Tax=Fusarium ambrosium TaxID=131363 RepID=A0A428U285_9HYPO|nr:hypothetical protein CDV31_008207 [Fusarium ambrosium]
MVLLSSQFSYILAGLFSAGVVFTAPTAPLPSNTISFALGVAAYRPVTQRPPPSQPNTDPANRPPPASPATPYTPPQNWRQPPKPDQGGGSGPPDDPEPTTPSYSGSSTYRLTKEEKIPSTNGGQGTSTNKEQGTSTSKQEDTSTNKQEDTSTTKQEDTSTDKQEDTSTNKEGTATNKQEGTSTTTELKPSESASTSIFASIPTIFGAITAVIVWLLI